MVAFDGTTGPKIGLFVDATDQSMPILDVAREGEARGFTGMFLNEHPHLPMDSARSSFPPGGPVPERYARFWCPYAALAMVAAQTSMEVGPSISLIAEHDPIALAKTVATLDVLTGGRFILGVGWGWHREEFEAQGLPANVRAAVLEEKLLLMKALWTEEVASFEGRFVRLPPARSWPKPVTRPHTPVYGGLPASDRNFARLARWADGWITMGSPLTLSDCSPLTWNPDLPFVVCQRRIGEELERVGREPSSFRYMCSINPLEPDLLRRAVEEAESLGIQRLNVRIPDAGADVVVPMLDRIAGPLHDLLG